MNKIGYTDVVVKITGEDLYLFENEIQIEGIPKPTPLAQLFGYTPNKIVYTYKFINN